MNKFKIGDKVLPIRPDSEEERDVFPSWIIEMDEIIGRAGEVIRINSKYIDVEFKKMLPNGNFRNRGFAFRKEWLKKFKRKIG